MRKSLLLVIGLSFLILGLVIIFKKDKNKVANQKINTSSLPKTNQSVKEIRVIAKNWQFDPPKIKVKQGEKVRLVIKSIDVAHGFFLPAFGINEKLNPGQEVKIEFIADKKGEYQFFCNVYCGSGHSDMSGRLIIE